MWAKLLFPSRVAELVGWKPRVLGVYLCKEPGWRREGVEWRNGELGSGRPQLRLDFVASAGRCTTELCSFVSLSCPFCTSASLSWDPGTCTQSIMTHLGLPAQWRHMSRSLPTLSSGLIYSEMLLIKAVQELWCKGNFVWWPQEPVPNLARVTVRQCSGSWWHILTTSLWGFFPLINAFTGNIYPETQQGAGLINLLNWHKRKTLIFFKSRVERAASFCSKHIYLLSIFRPRVHQVNFPLAIKVSS